MHKIEEYRSKIEEIKGQIDERPDLRVHERWKRMKNKILGVFREIKITRRLHIEEDERKDEEIKIQRKVT